MYNIYCFDCDICGRAEGINCMEYSRREDPQINKGRTETLKFSDQKHQYENTKYLKKNRYKRPPSKGVDNFFDFLNIVSVSFCAILILSSLIAWFVDEYII